MNEKGREVINKIIIFVAVVVSVYFFGFSFSLFVSLGFIFYLYILNALQDIRSSGAGALAPVLLNIVKKNNLITHDFTPIIAIVNSFLAKYKVNFSLTKDMIDTVIVYALLFVLARLCLKDDHTTMGKHPPGGNPEFKEKTFIELQADFCVTFSQRLQRINRDEKWSSNQYVPIETEVELTKGHKIKRYDDLLKCLKMNKTNAPFFVKYIVKKISNSSICKIRLFNRFIKSIERRVGDNIVYLVLGDPGSGKSVSLRKLCSELLDETHITGKTPVYISLKNWSPETGEWSEENLPTQMDLINFIKKELYSDGDLHSHKFLDAYFNPMIEDGRFYFIFDSFDEMPCLMGGDKNGDLIKRISELLHEFLTGPNQSGGIIASRLYNRPSDYLEQTYTLRLQKFDNSRIRKMFKQYLVNEGDKIVIKLFKERIDLVELCRNPLHLSLLIEYLNQSHDFPSNQFELFKYFVESRLEESKTKIKKVGFELQSEIYEAAIDIAVMMQKDKNYGLDYPIDRIFCFGKRFDRDRWEKCISALTYAKLCRIGGNGQTVSFVHRRFQEFFFVEAIIRNMEKVGEEDLSGILNNTGMRDALVLYCQIADENRIKDIIDFCIDAIQSNVNDICGVLNDGSIKLVNSLYFLIESFTNRKQVLGDNVEVIKNLNKSINRETHYVILTAIVNSISLLDSNSIQVVLHDVFILKNRWLNSIIVGKCQLIKKLDYRVEKWFCMYFEHTEPNDFLRDFLSVDFSLSLSECFTYVRKIHILLSGVLLSKVIHYVGVVACLLPYMGITIRTFIDLFRKLLYNVFNGTLQQEVVFLSNKSVDTTIMNISKPLSIVQNILLLNVSIMLSFALIVYVSDCYGILNMEYVRNSASEVKKKHISKKDVIEMIVLIRKVLFGKKEQERKSVNISSNWLMPVDIVFLAPIVFIVVLILPNSPLLYIFGIFEIYLTVYFIYRFNHEVLDPLVMKSDNLIEAFRMIPHLISSHSKEIILAISVSLLTLVIVVVCSGLIILLFLIGIVMICYVTGNELSIHNMMIISCLVIVFIYIGFILFTVVLILKNCILMVMMTKKTTETIERETLILNIKKLRFRNIKRMYVKTLMGNSVKLCGEWPENYSNHVKDDVLIRNLAIWDSKESQLANRYVDII